MKLPVVVMVSIVFAVAAVACAESGSGRGAARPRAPIVAPPELAGLVVMTATEPEISTTDDDCKTYSTGVSYPGKLRYALEAALAEAGLTVVTDASKPHDVELHLRFDFTRCTKNPADGGVNGTVFATVKADSAVIATVQAGDQLTGCKGIEFEKKSKGSIQGRHLIGMVPAGDRSLFAQKAVSRGGGGGCGDVNDEIVSTLLEGLAQSNRLLALAKQRHGTDAAQASSTAAPRTSNPPPGASPFVSGAPQPNAYAVIIGIEKYGNGLPAPTGARADAESFARLATASLGVAPNHMQLAIDDRATKGGVERAIEWARSSTPEGGRIYFFFSGHGAPDASAGTSYIVPSDGDPKYLDATGIPMKEVLAKLGQSKAREVLAIVDACFSGAGGRSVLPPGARPLVRVTEEVAPAQLALFSASSGSETSGPVPGGTGGLFTKFLIDGLGTGAADVNGDGQVSLGELATWVKPRVAREAKKDNRDQNPSVTIGSRLGSADAFIVEWGLPAK